MRKFLQWLLPLSFLATAALLLFNKPENSLLEAEIHSKNEESIVQEKPPTDTVEILNGESLIPEVALQEESEKQLANNFSRTIPESESLSSPYKAPKIDQIRKAQTEGELWSNNYRIGDTWAVRINNSDELKTIANELNATYLGPVESVPGVYIFQIKGSEETSKGESVAQYLNNNASITWFEQQILERFALDYDLSPPQIDDPTFSNQWHHFNKGDGSSIAGEDANVYPAWNYGFSGEGVIIGIVDTGTQHAHPDLNANYRTDLDRNFLSDGVSSDAKPMAADETHGTAVAGVAAAGANNSCGIGVAFNAEITGIRLIDEETFISDANQASAIAWQQSQIDIYNNSWGPGVDDGARMAGPGTLAYSAIQNAVTRGRGGKGAIYVWAAGNGLDVGNNVNYNGWASTRYTIAVGAVGNMGKQSLYSEPGAPMLICAPSSGNTTGIRTTDLLGAEGRSAGDCRTGFGGTSSASPLIAGVVALMLEANPELNWRDVQHILAKTAVKVDANDSDWTQNGAGYWVNHKYGYGRVDAAAASIIAETWESVPAATQISSNSGTLNTPVPYGTTGTTVQLAFAQDLLVEHVEIFLDMTTQDWGELDIILTSPSGTESVLAELHYDDKKEYDDWTYGSVRHLDEHAQGTWSLKVIDRQSANNASIRSWRITIHGTPIDPESNSKPMAVDDIFIAKSYPIQIDVTDNDTDSEDDILEIVSIYQSPKGITTILPDNRLLYTSNSTSGGTDTVGYTIHDGNGGLATGKLIITNPLPIAIDDYVGTFTNTTQTIPVLLNDSDPENSPLSLVSITPPENGIATILNNEIIYTPNNGFSGEDQFNYTVTDNDDGEAEGTVTITIPNNDNLAIELDGIDDYIEIIDSPYSVFNGAFSVETWIRPTSYGEAEYGYARILDSENVIIYLHSEGFSSGDGQSYNDHSLLFNITHTNGDNSIHNTPPHSIELNKWQHIAMTYDGVDTVKMYIDGVEQTLKNDFDSASGPAKSNSQVNNIYIGESASLNRAFKGRFDEYRIWSKALSSSEILSQKNSIITSGVASLSVNYNMNEGVSNELQDTPVSDQVGSMNKARWVKGFIGGTNNEPNANNDSYVVYAHEETALPVTENDTDPDGDTLEVARIISLTEGTASIQEGKIIYNVANNFSGAVTLVYEVSDKQNGTATASVSITVKPPLTYNQWKDLFSSTSIGSQSEDADADSLSNFDEYAFGSNPISGTFDTTRLNVQRDLLESKIYFTYTTQAAGTDIEYGILISNDLMSWRIPFLNLDYETASISNNEDGTQTTVLSFNAPENDPIFLRIKAVELPEP